MAGWTDLRPRRPNRESDAFFRDRAESRKALVRRRLSVGFECHGEKIGGRWREAFIEPGLRSEGSHVLRRIVQLTPKASRLAVGRTKDVMQSTDSKLLGLDDPYVVLNGKVRGAFRLDLDLTFQSWEALRFEISQLLLPCLPHVAIGFELPDGRVERPHVLFLLPYGSEVWFDPDDQRCRRDIMQLWRGVHAGLTKRFLALGADPGALSNPMRIKNPLSPFWKVKTWNETAFPDLSEWAGWVDTRTNRDAMIRESAAALSGADRRASNALFSTFQVWSYDMLKDMHSGGDAAYAKAILRKDRDALAELVFRGLVGRASRIGDRPEQAQAILYRVVVYAADHWDPSRVSHDGSRNRGACSVEVEDLSDTQSRQAFGGKYAAARRSERNLVKVIEARRALMAEGLVPTKLDVAARADLSRPTVQKHWSAATAALDEGV